MALVYSRAQLGTPGASWVGHGGEAQGVTEGRGRGPGDPGRLRHILSATSSSLSSRKAQVVEGEVGE